MRMILLRMYMVLLQGCTWLCCRYRGLFCRYIGLFYPISKERAFLVVETCYQVDSAVGVYGSVANVYRALLQIYRALLKIYGTF